jgi:hypothetical protein
LRSNLPLFMPFGTKEIADSSKDLSEKIGNFMESTSKLGESTKILSQSTNDLIASTSGLQKSTQLVGESTTQLTQEMTAFRQEMHSFVGEMGLLRTSLDKTAEVLATQLSHLSNILQDFGKYATRSMVDNIKESASTSIGKVFPNLGKLLPNRDDKSSS